VTTLAQKNIGIENSRWRDQTRSEKSGIIVGMGFLENSRSWQVWHLNAEFDYLGE
jgi:hypothetical protein